MREQLIQSAVDADNREDSLALADCIEEMNHDELREFQSRVGGLFKGMQDS